MPKSLHKEKDYVKTERNVYTKKEVVLQKSLLEECLNRPIDWERVENLLRMGADPLGGLAVSGSDVCAHVYEELIPMGEDSTDEFSKITKLFLEYGMDVNNPRVPYDLGDSINPLWAFAFVPCKECCLALGMLLEKGVNGELIDDFLSHAIDEHFFIYSYNPNAEEHREQFEWLYKEIMLCASYDKVLNQSQRIKKDVDYANNDYDIQKFRNWNAYRYEFDTSRCTPQPELYRSIIRIYDVQTGKLVWKISVA